MAPFSSVGAYNPDTTVQPIICQFCKNVDAISAVLAVGYKKVKNCATVALNGFAVVSVVAYLPTPSISIHSTKYAGSNTVYRPTALGLPKYPI